MVLRLVCVLLLSARCLAGQSVEGSVVSTVTGAGVPGVRVVIQAAEREFASTTDEGGWFSVKDIEAGTYTARFSKAGYLWSSPKGDGAESLQVTAGFSPSPLRTEMVPLAGVSGRVVDGGGRPVAGAAVELEGPGSLLTYVTGEQGRFDFQNLLPGNYTIAASAPDNWPPPGPVEDEPRIWRRTFYPGSATRESGAPVPLPGGSDVRGIEVKLVAAPLRKVRGVIVDASGAPAAGAAVTLSSSAGAVREGITGVAGGNGAFELSAPDGLWNVEAALARDGAELRAFRAIAIAGAVRDPLKLRLAEAFSIEGRILLDPPLRGGVPGKTVAIALVKTGGFRFTQPSDVPGADGWFHIRGLYSGTYSIEVSRPPYFGEYYLSSIRLGEREALGTELELTSGSLGLEIAFQANGGTVQGTVENCGRAAVLLRPLEPELRRQGLRRAAVCDAGGHFEIAAVRPGDYYVFAVDPRHPAATEVTRDLDQTVINGAVRITVRSGERARADLTVIPWAGN